MKLHLELDVALIPHIYSPQDKSLIVIFIHVQLFVFALVQRKKILLSQKKKKPIVSVLILSVHTGYISHRIDATDRKDQKG